MFEFINKEPSSKLELVAQNVLVFGMLFGLIAIGSLVNYN